MPAIQKRRTLRATKLAPASILTRRLPPIIANFDSIHP
jgi:hypothetical protein